MCARTTIWFSVAFSQDFLFVPTCFTRTRAQHISYHMRWMFHSAFADSMFRCLICCTLHVLQWWRVVQLLPVVNQNDFMNHYVGSIRRLSFDCLYLIMSGSYFCLSFADCIAVLKAQLIILLRGLACSIFPLNRNLSFDISRAKFCADVSARSEQMIWPLLSITWDQCMSWLSSETHSTPDLNTIPYTFNNRYRYWFWLS